MADKSSLAGKYAVVTGSTQGLGEAIARLFVERGVAGLIICGRNVERGMTVAANLNSDTCQVHFVQADLANVEDCRRIIATADEHFGIVHILVNAAGVSDRGTIWDTSPELWDWIMAINVRAPFILIQETIKIMSREKVEGSIVNIGGLSSYTGAARRAHVIAAKAGLVGLTRALAHDLAPHGVTVNCVAPGLIDTARRGPEPSHHAKHETLVGRRGTPEEIAAVVRFLCGPDARYITGQTLHANGGVYMA